MSTGKHYFIEQIDVRRYAIRGKGSARASDTLDTQREAIARVHELNPYDHPDVERVRDTKVGGRDKWRLGEVARGSQPLRLAPRRFLASERPRRFDNGLG